MLIHWYMEKLNVFLLYSVLFKVFPTVQCHAITLFTIILNGNTALRAIHTEDGTYNNAFLYSYFRRLLWIIHMFTVECVCTRVCVLLIFFVYGCVCTHTVSFFKWWLLLLMACPPHLSLPRTNMYSFFYSFFSTFYTNILHTWYFTCSFLRSS